jgi:hypothetical protein
MYQCQQGFAYLRLSDSADTAKAIYFFTNHDYPSLLKGFVRPDSSMVEQLTFNQLVRGSSPRPATSNKT